MKTVHITNGDAAVGVLRQGGASGHIIPWRDLPHDGPLLPVDSLDEQSANRAIYCRLRLGGVGGGSGRFPAA